MLPIDQPTIADPLLFAWVFGRNSSLTQELVTHAFGKELNLLASGGNGFLGREPGASSCIVNVLLCAPEAESKPSAMLLAPPLFTACVQITPDAANVQAPHTTSIVAGTASLVICRNDYDPFGKNRMRYLTRNDGSEIETPAENEAPNVVLCPYGTKSDEDDSLASFLAYLRGSRKPEVTGNKFVGRVREQVAVAIEDPLFIRQRELVEQLMRESSTKAKQAGYSAGFEDGRKSGRLDGFGDGYMDGLRRRDERLDKLDQKLRKAGRDALADRIRDNRKEQDALFRKYGVS